jgi:large subunit ribosomal protein L17
MLRNMMTSLIRHERIRTTKAKAQEVRRKAEKMITRAKVDSVHNRRIAARDIQDKDTLNRLFTEVGPRFTTRPGGYTRMLKLGRRYGDAAEVVILELVERGDSGDGKKKKREKTRKSAPASEEKAPVEETADSPPRQPTAKEEASEGEE